MKQFKERYGNAVNLSGLYHKKPVPLIWDEELKCFYDKPRNLDVPRKKGVSVAATGGCITFSGSYKETKNWTEGARAVLLLLRQFSKNS